MIGLEEISMNIRCPPKFFVVCMHLKQPLLRLYHTVKEVCSGPTEPLSVLRPLFKDSTIYLVTGGLVDSKQM